MSNYLRKRPRTGIILCPFCGYSHAKEFGAYYTFKRIYLYDFLIDIKDVFNDKKISECKRLIFNCDNCNAKLEEHLQIHITSRIKINREYVNTGGYPSKHHLISLYITLYNTDKTYNTPVYVLTNTSYFYQYIKNAYIALANSINNGLNKNSRQNNAENLG